MQLVLRDRVNQSQAVIALTQPVDMSGYPAFTFSLVAHDVNGTSPTLDVEWETSDNLEDWTQVGGNTQLTAAGMDSGLIRVAGGDQLLRYVRAKITTAGTNVAINYSLTMNLFSGT